jgi:ABC-type xylose transport system permease subunit
VEEVLNEPEGEERRSRDIANMEDRAEIDVSEKVFANGPNMLVLCLTVIGLIKIYTRFEKITTLADNFLAFISLGYLAATVIAYMALRTRDSRARLKLSRFADVTFLVSLGLTAAVALFMTFALEG